MGENPCHWQVNVGFFSMNIALYIHHPAVESWRFTAEHVRWLEKTLPNDRFHWARTEAEFLDILPQMEGAMVWTFKANWFARAPRLRWLATPAAGRDHLPPHPPEGLGYSFGAFHGAIISETVLGMMLNVCRNLTGWSGSLREESWPQAQVSSPMRLLAGSNVVLCGFGPIGQAIARCLKQRGVQLSVIRKKSTDFPSWMDSTDQILTVSEADASGVWTSADHVILALPGDAGTQHFLSEDRLDHLSSTCWVYNVGRGSCVDEAALIRCLKSRSIGGACLDVFEQEPLPEVSLLRTLENVHLLPHLSAVSDEYIPLFLEEMVQERLKTGSS